MQSEWEQLVSRRHWPGSMHQAVAPGETNHSLKANATPEIHRRVCAHTSPPPFTYTHHPGQPHPYIVRNAFTPVSMCATLSRHFAPTSDRNWKGLDLYRHWEHLNSLSCQ